MQPYIKNWQIFVCPSQSGAGDMSLITVQGTNAYGNNAATRGIPDSTIRYPAELCVFGDGRHWDINSGNQGWVHAYANVCTAGCTTANRIDSNARHNGGSNTAFADGHAKWLNAVTIGSYCAPTSGALYFTP